MPEPIPTEQVYGLYDTGWGDLISEASYIHPAKASRKLAFWIVKTGIERGWWYKGDLLLDVFCGIGGFGIAAAAQGMRFIGVELEQRFVDLCHENFARHAAEWLTFGLPLPTCIQGDSRRLCEIVRAEVGGAVTSPPYVSGGHHADQTGAWNTNGRGQGGTKEQAGYGASEGQLGRMSAITSPPYESSLKDGRDPAEKLAKAAARIGGHFAEQLGDPGHTGAYGATYGTNPENIGNMQADSYWSAVRVIYENLFALFSPGSHLACVVKSYVKNGAIVDLPGMTLDLLVDIGFEPVLEVRAMLTAEHEQGSMMPETVPSYRRRRSSFFRRLHERKHPETSIDWETVLVVRKS